MKPATNGKVGRPPIGDRAMTSGERSKRYRSLTKGEVHSRSFELTTTARNELQRAADHAGISVNAALLVAINLLSKETSVEVAELARLAAHAHGVRIELTDERGKKSRISVGGNRRNP